MVERKSGVILNVSSMTAFRPLTRVVAYGGAKAAINNFTQWLAVHFALEYSPIIRVNAIAPGFFLGDQNRDLLIDKTTVIDYGAVSRLSGTRRCTALVNRMICWGRCCGWCRMRHGL